MLITFCRKHVMKSYGRSSKERIGCTHETI